MTPEELFAANLAFAKERYPALFHAASGIAQPLSRLVREADGLLDIDLGSGRFYKMAADEFARRQVDEFVANPTQVGLKLPDGAHTQSNVSLRTLSAVLRSLEREGIDEFSQAPVAIPGYLIALGLGLGRHLDMLLDKIEVMNIVVIEPIQEFIYWFMHTTDLAQLTAKADSKNVRLFFSAADAPGTIIRDINEAIFDVGAAYLDGAYIFRHYPSYELNEAYKDFAVHLPLYFYSKGFYEDEVKMLRNCSGNYIENEVYMVDGIRRPRRAEPAFILAAGPSLDMGAETIRQWRDHAVVFTCGSTLEAALARGIVPDYHVELENVPEVVDQMEHILDRFPDMFPDRTFGDVKLIASNTVNARVPKYFSETYLFFRDSVSSTYLFGRKWTNIAGVGPNCANTGVAMAAVLGFSNQYLFGVDCGFKDPRRHHAGDTMYYTSEKFLRAEQSHNATCPGNFGGTVYIDPIYGWSRDMIGIVASRFRLRVYNCSDGAMIPETTPKAIEAVEFDHPPLDKQAIFAEIREASLHCRPGEFFRKETAEEYLKLCDMFAADFMKVVAESVAEGKDFRSFNDRITRFLAAEDLGEKYPGISRMVSGSGNALPKIAMYFLNRIADPAARDRVFRDFAREFQDICQFMCDDMRSHFLEIKERLEALPAPADA